MKKPIYLIAPALLLFGTSVHATGMHSCSVTDKAAWLSEAALTEMLENDGWSVRRMKEDGGCWEVYGTDPEGRRVEGYFHPVTGKAELISQRGRILFEAGNSN